MLFVMMPNRCDEKSSSDMYTHICLCECVYGTIYIIVLCCHFNVYHEHNISTLLSPSTSSLASSTLLLVYTRPKWASLQGTGHSRRYIDNEHWVESFFPPILCFYILLYIFHYTILVQNILTYRRTCHAPKCPTIDLPIGSPYMDIIVYTRSLDRDVFRVSQKTNL